jgi:chromosome segregation ATPase
MDINDKIMQNELFSDYTN